MNAATAAVPMIVARTPLEMASVASEGPTSYCSLIWSATPSGLLSTLERSTASRWVKEPEISALPPLICSRTVGAE